LVEKKALLKPLSVLYIVGGIVTIISAIFLGLIKLRLGAILAIPSLVVFLLVAATELSAGRTTWRSEVGSWRSIVSTSVMVLLVRALFIYLGLPDANVAGAFFFDSGDAWNVLFYANVVLLVTEVLVLVYISRHSEFFMLQECDPSENRPDLASCTVKSVSECPACHEVVETYWQSCPYCGTSLPHICAECGGELGAMLTKCPHCGKEVMQSISLKKTIDTFQKLAREDALPETKAIRFARLAEALLKNGQADEAVTAYRQAIEFTRFTRKRTNFMVQAARILKNTGHQAEASKLLDDALALDPQDYAGAAAIKSEMGPKPSPA
jgi:tetratricopeptide (TPR) repeat protein